jgi:hypothetical protein
LADALPEQRNGAFVSTIIAGQEGICLSRPPHGHPISRWIQAQESGTVIGDRGLHRSADHATMLSGLACKFVGGWSGIVEVEAGGAVESFFGGAGGVPSGQDLVLVAVFADEVEGESPAVG